MTEKLDLDALDRLLAAAPKELAIKSADVRRTGLTVHFTHAKGQSANDAAFNVVHAACACFPEMLAELRALRRVAAAAAELRTQESIFAFARTPTEVAEFSGRVTEKKRTLDAALKEAGL